MRDLSRRSFLRGLASTLGVSLAACSGVPLPKIASAPAIGVDWAGPGGDRTVTCRRNIKPFIDAREWNTGTERREAELAVGEWQARQFDGLLDRPQFRDLLERLDMDKAFPRSASSMGQA